MSRPPGRLDAWSRRKARVAEAEALERAAAERAAVEAAMEGRSDAEICAELGLPDPQSLGPGDDFAAFLKSEVPERLRRAALRKLWRSNPALANVDGLVEYGEDFTISTGAGEALTTAYRVGKGFFDEVEEAAAEPAEEPAQAETEVEAEAALAAPGPAPEARAHPNPEEILEEAAEQTPSEQIPATAPAPRRMRFEFHDQESQTA